jgi:hypothetical protein
VINNGQVYLTTDTSDLVKHEYVKSIWVWNVLFYLL